ncbi:MAG TPA: arylamine N-acetyltransferase [bacterium]|nr:arylamine N-acetyltransferase [bacterium]
MTDPLAPPLNPWRHAAAVRHFLGHFGLAAGAPDHLQLEKVLFHFSRLPYENISKIVKLNHHFRTIERIRLPEEVMDDYVRHNLGGTCFSLSFFLQCILLHLGYSAYIVMADMGSRRNVHCALIVELQGGKFLVDPGYLLTRAMAFHRDRSSIHTSPQSGVELRYDLRANAMPSPPSTGRSKNCAIPLKTDPPRRRNFCSTGSTHFIRG